MARKIFEQAMMSSPKKSAFDLSHEHKTTTQFSKLTPILNMEVVPGDQIAVNSEILVRMAPTIAPIMHRVDVYVHHFFVPNRIVWDKWEDFIFPKNDSSTPPLMPTVTINAISNQKRFETGSLANHLGIPAIDVANLIDPIEVSQLPFRAYLGIYNDFYRDQNLEDEIAIDNTTEMLKLRFRAWEKDYFTSALPYAQKGPAVKIPTGAGSLLDTKLADLNTGLNVTQGNITADLDGTIINDSADGGQINFEGSEMGTTIEDLRRSARLQEWLEKAARAGTRYKEGIKSFFGTNIGDARLDRPEYLGGGKQPITISEVLNTTGNISNTNYSDTQPNVQGDMAGHGIAVGGKNNFKYSVKEHGHIISIMSIMPKPAYQQGIDKLWTRNDRFDYYWPEFANLGEQEVKNQELYVTTDAATREQTFGYQQKYAEYKYSSDKVTGDFAGNLDFWHLGRKFANQPYLNNIFIKPNVSEFERIFAVDSKTTGSDQFWCQIYHDVKARRPMPYFGTPKL